MNKLIKFQEKEGKSEIEEDYIELSSIYFY